MCLAIDVYDISLTLVDLSERLSETARIVHYRLC